MKRKMLFCLALSFFLSYAFAAKVSPVRFDLSIARGSSQEFKLKIIGSKGLYNQDLSIYASDFSMSREGAYSFDLKNGKNSAVQFIELEKNKLSLLEDQSKEIKFKVSIPFNAEPGEYYAVIMVEPSQFTDVKDKSQMLKFQMKSRVAVVVILEVPGRTYEKKGVALDLNVLKTDSVVAIKTAFKNTSNIHLEVAGEAVIKSADGRISYGKFDLKALSSPTSKAFIFPDGTRDFVGFLDRQLPSGDYLADVSFNYGYDFKKVRIVQKFSVVRKVNVDESQAEFIRFNVQSLKLDVPEGARRTQVVSITNIDYRPLNVDIVAPDWIKITPASLILKAGEVRNVMLTISVPKYDQSNKKEAALAFKPERGKVSEIKVYATGLK